MKPLPCKHIIASKNDCWICSTAGKDETILCDDHHRKTCLASPGSKR